MQCQTMCSAKAVGTSMQGPPGLTACTRPASACSAAQLMVRGKAAGIPARPLTWDQLGASAAALAAEGAPQLHGCCRALSAAPAAVQLPAASLRHAALSCVLPFKRHLQASTACSRRLYHASFCAPTLKPAPCKYRDLHDRMLLESSSLLQDCNWQISGCATQLAQL